MLSSLTDIRLDRESKKKKKREKEERRPRERGKNDNKIKRTKKKDGTCESQKHVEWLCQINRDL